MFKLCGLYRPIGKFSAQWPSVEAPLQEAKDCNAAIATRVALHLQFIDYFQQLIIFSSLSIIFSIDILKYSKNCIWWIRKGPD